MKPITENHIETIAIETLQSLGWEYIYGLAIAPGAAQQERENYEQVILTERLRKAVAVLNPHVPQAAQEQAIQKVLRMYSGQILHDNEIFHQYLIEKVKIPYQQDGYERSHEVALIDFDNWQNNTFLAVNQYIIVENGQNKRPDVLLFVNGIPLVLMELKNAAGEQATLSSAYQQVQTYKATIPSLFTYNAVCVISDGHECRAGSVSAGYNRYMAWKTIDGSKEASRFKPQLGVLILGMLNPATFLDLVRNFIVFEKTTSSPALLQKGEGSRKADGIIQIITEKKLAAYHQYHAVNKAIESTIKAAGFQPSFNSSQREESHYRGRLEFSGLINEARELRKNQTKAEEIFWELVRNRKFKSLKFRRQHQVGSYIVDFYCNEQKLIIEFDGEVYDSQEQQKHDSIRDKYLTTIGNKVLRFNLKNY